MPTIEANPTVTATHTCPLCDAVLDPAHPNECPKCDWVPGYGDQQLKYNNTRDVIAVFLSVIPGLGHMYKGYRLTGALYLLGSIFAMFAIVVAATFTAGWALLLAPLYWAGVMLQVYLLEDKGVKQQRVA